MSDDAQHPLSPPALLPDPPAAQGSLADIDTPALVELIEYRRRQAAAVVARHEWLKAELAVTESMLSRFSPQRPTAVNPDSPLPAGRKRRYFGRRKSTYSRNDRPLLEYCRQALRAHAHAPLDLKTLVAMVLAANYKTTADLRKFSYNLQSRLVTAEKNKTPWLVKMGAELWQYDTKADEQKVGPANG